MASKLWQTANSDSSDSSDSSDGEVQESKTGRRWIEASDSSDSDGDTRAPVKSARDKKWDQFAVVAKNIGNFLKNGDWSKLFDGALALVSCARRRRVGVATGALVASHRVWRPHRRATLPCPCRGRQARDGA
jgi:hypothetical protein